MADKKNNVLSIWVLLKIEELALWLEDVKFIAARTNTYKFLVNPEKDMDKISAESDELFVQMRMSVKCFELKKLITPCKTAYQIWKVLNKEVQKRLEEFINMYAKLHRQTTFDVKTAFLNAELDESIYVDQLQGFKDNSGRIWKLNRAFYGLKQASFCWNKTFTKKMIDFGFIAMTPQHCVILRKQAQLILTQKRSLAYRVFG